LSTGPLALSLAEIFPTTCYDSPRKKANNSAFKFMNMTSIFTDSSLIACIFLQMRITEYTVMIILYELKTFQRDQREKVLSSRFGYSKYCYKFQDQTFNDATVVSSSWDSTVGIVTGYGLDSRGVSVRVLIR
jgi:hypothetical protein